MDETGLDEALIANGDTFMGGSLKQMLLPLDVSCGELMRIATVKVADRRRFGGLSVDTNHYVTTFLEKGQTGAGSINAGLYRINKRAFEGSDLLAFSMETEIMPFLVAKNALSATEVSGPFMDIGVPDDYRLFDACVEDYVRQS
jgi:D-glycero-alpha-D-manno-heptose 1-phosphate guanylyltransferase